MEDLKSSYKLSYSKAFPTSFEPLPVSIDKAVAIAFTNPRLGVNNNGVPSKTKGWKSPSITPANSSLLGVGTW
ncbi:MAG: hypothetical protein QM731_13295 [Chitinophagaceae bacterium]